MSENTVGSGSRAVSDLRGHLVCKEVEILSVSSSPTPRLSSLSSCQKIEWRTKAGDGNKVAHSLAQKSVVPCYHATRLREPPQCICELLKADLATGPFGL